MPVAKTLQDYLLNPSATLPRMKSVSKAIREILRILEQRERGGGATYSLYFGDQWRQPCFAVGLSNDISLRLDSHFDLPEEVQGFLKRHRDLLKHPRCCLGIWKGMTEDGIVRAYLDIAVLVFNETIARQFGAEGDQIAIFDLRTGVEIDTGGTGWSFSGAPSPQESLQWVEAQDTFDSLEETAHE